MWKGNSSTSLVGKKEVLPVLINLKPFFFGQVFELMPFSHLISDNTFQHFKLISCQIRMNSSPANFAQCWPVLWRLIFDFQRLQDPGLFVSQLHAVTSLSCLPWDLHYNPVKVAGKMGRVLFVPGRTNGTALGIEYPGAQGRLELAPSRKPWFPFISKTGHEFSWQQMKADTNPHGHGDGSSYSRKSSLFPWVQPVFRHLICHRPQTKVGDQTITI